MQHVRTLRLVVFAVLLAIAPLASHAAAASSTYTISARALVGPNGTDVYVSATPAVAAFEKIQLKAWPLEPGAVQTRNFFDVETVGGVATLHLDDVARGSRIEVAAHVKDGPQNNVETDAVALLRPNLTVQALNVPADVTRRHTFDVGVDVAEVAGDTDASAVVTLYDGTTKLGEQLIAVAAHATRTSTFTIALDPYGTHQLRAEITGAAPAESNVADNSSAVQVDVHRYLQDGVVSSEDKYATAAGIEVLRAGGNALDAAAAVMFALSVTEPHLAGIGGSANVVVRLADGTQYAIDGRETAAAATTARTFERFSDRCTVADRASCLGLEGFVVGVPGLVRAIDAMLHHGGTMSLSATLQPAIRLAAEGFTVGSFLAADSRSPRVKRASAELQALVQPGGTPLAEGTLLVQPDLAKTLRLIAAQGPSVFYEGEIAQAIVAAQHWQLYPGGAGQMTLQDLAGYDVRIEDPLRLQYGGYTLLGAPPSTCGGLVVLEALGLIDHFKRNHPGYAWTFGQTPSVHVMLEALRLANADRDMWVGDDDFYAVPSAGLLDDEYLDARSRLIKPGFLVAGEPLPAIPGTPGPGSPPASASTLAAAEVDDASSESHTTHFSVIDKLGNAVAFTATVTDSFGSGILVPGYGFVLNDTNINFNQSPAKNVATGNPGANDAGPGKRAMGNTAPTLVVRDGETLIGTGSTGSKFIPSTVVGILLDVVDFGMGIQDAVDAPRIWGQNAHGDFAANPGLAAIIPELRALGHQEPWSGNVARSPVFPGVGSMNSFAVGADTITLAGGADTARHPDATATVLTR